MIHFTKKLTGMIVSLLLIVSLCISMYGCTANPDTPDVTVSVTEGTSAVEETKPIPTEAPTQPTEIETEPAEIETEPTEPAFSLHSGLREDGSFDEGTLFIGDSLTYGLTLYYLKPNGLLGDAKYISAPGAPATSFFSWAVLNPSKYPSCTNVPELNYLNLSEAVAQIGDGITAVYFMMGTNYDDECDVSTYVEIIDYTLEKCPDATFYLQTIPMVLNGKIPYEQVNRIIWKVYEYYQQQDNPRVILLDPIMAIGENLNPDGIHLNGTGQALWYEEIVRFTQDRQIPQ